MMHSGKASLRRRCITVTVSLLSIYLVGCHANTPPGAESMSPSKSGAVAESDPGGFIAFADAAASESSSGELGDVYLRWEQAEKALIPRLHEDPSLWEPMTTRLKELARKGPRANEEATFSMSDICYEGKVWNLLLHEDEDRALSVAREILTDSQANEIRRSMVLDRLITRRRIALFIRWPDRLADYDRKLVPLVESLLDERYRIAGLNHTKSYVGALLGYREDVPGLERLRLPDLPAMDRERGLNLARILAGQQQRHFSNRIPYYAMLLACDPSDRDTRLAELLAAAEDENLYGQERIDAAGLLDKYKVPISPKLRARLVELEKEQGKFTSAGGGRTTLEVRNGVTTIRHEPLEPTQSKSQ